MADRPTLPTARFRYRSGMATTHRNGQCATRGADTVYRMGIRTSAVAPPTPIARVDFFASLSARWR